MLTCWSCQKEVQSTEIFCGSCQRLQPARAMNPFDLLKLPQTYSVNAEILQKQYLATSKTIHPDKFAQASSRERRFAMEQTTAFQQAYKTIRSDVKRAEYLLRAQGFTPLADDAGKPGSGQSMPIEFYEQVMEDREALMEARTQGVHEVERLTSQMQAKQEAVYEFVAHSFEQFETTHDPMYLQPIVLELSKLKYYQRFIDEAEGRPHE